ncbi:MAG TPA: ABC transporter permease, partial [Chryseosolibacter sp.]|nr:ABC transporter permease [Chryseosolibacter sp.]
MLRNYFSVIARNILRNKTYSLINLLGLSLGTAVCLIILQYVRFEESFDTFHSKADHLYRVIREFTNSDGLTQRDAAQFAPAGEALKSTFPEVTGYVRITPEYSKVVLSHNDRKFEVDKVYYADSTFFSLFDFKLLQGDRTNVLTDARSVVISRTTAEKYFGPMDSWQESPIGKILVMNNNEVLKVTGIMEDFPANSHFRANALLSFTTFLLHNDPSQFWGWNDFYTYIDLKPGTDYKRFESKLPGIIAKYKGKD